MPDFAIPASVQRQRQLKQYGYVAAACVVFLVLLIWALTRTPAGRGIQRSELWIATVQAGPLDIVVNTTGTFKPGVERWITAVSPGVVETVNVQPGDSVKPNTVLATLSNPTLQSALVQARADVANADATRASLTAQLSSQLLDLEGSLAAADANAKIAVLKESAEQKLFSQHIVSQIDYASTQLTAQELEKLVTLTQQRVETFHDSMAAQIRAADAQAAALRAVLSDRQRQVDALRVTANLEGVVQDVAIQLGQTLAVGGEIAHVANLKSLKASLQVPASQANGVVVGQQVTLELSTSDMRVITGHVTRVSPAVSNDDVDVDVIPDGALPADVRPNLAMTGQIHIANITKTLFIQRPAYANANSTMTLYRLSDNEGVATPILVHFGAASDRNIQVLSGLGAGEKVIVSDTSSFSDAKQVTIH